MLEPNSPAVTDGVTPPELVVTDPETAARACPECESLMVAGAAPADGMPTKRTCPDCGYSEITCPDCHQAMTRTEGDDGSAFECKPCAEQDGVAGEKADAPAPTDKTRSLGCQECGLQIRALLIGGEVDGPIRGFTLIAIEKVGAAGNVSMETTFGRSANGFPLCPTDNVALLPLGPVPVNQAFRGISDALQDASVPKQARLPHTSPPFNLEEALDSIAKKHHDVEAAQRTYNYKKEAAANAKKDWESQVDQLGRLISEIETRREEYDAAARGRLTPAQDSECLYERRAGKTCQTCRTDRKKAKEESGDDVDVRLVSVRAHLVHRGVHLEELDLADLAGRNGGVPIDELEAWAHNEDAGVKAPDLFDVMCIAGPAGETGQRCTTCGVLLHSKTDEDEDGATPYPEGDRVGLDCAGDPNAPAVDETPEPARQPQRRHKDPKDAAAAKTKAAKAERAEKTAEPAKSAKASKKRTRSR